MAAAAFLAEGYQGASMSRIAARLGGSKGTLYRYFPSKEALFDAHVRRYCAAQAEAMFALLAAGDSVEAALTAFGRGFLAFVVSDLHLRNFRLITAEAERSPVIGRAFYEAGPLNGVRRLADFLEQAANAGRLRLDRPLEHAHAFIGLVQNRMLKARLCCVMDEPSPEEVDREVAGAVQTFLAAYGVVPDA